jgi:hypothetical protein
MLRAGSILPIVRVFVCGNTLAGSSFHVDLRIKDVVQLTFRPSRFAVGWTVTCSCHLNQTRARPNFN